MWRIKSDLIIYQTDPNTEAKNLGPTHPYQRRFFLKDMRDFNSSAIGKRNPLFERKACPNKEAPYALQNRHLDCSQNLCQMTLLNAKSLKLQTSIWRL